MYSGHTYWEGTTGQMLLDDDGRRGIMLNKALAVRNSLYSGWNKHAGVTQWRQGWGRGRTARDRPGAEKGGLGRRLYLRWLSSFSGREGERGRGGRIFQLKARLIKGVDFERPTLWSRNFHLEMKRQGQFKKGIPECQRLQIPIQNHSLFLRIQNHSLFPPEKICSHRPLSDFWSS